MNVANKFILVVDEYGDEVEDKELVNVEEEEFTRTPPDLRTLAAKA